MNIFQHFHEIVNKIAISKFGKNTYNFSIEIPKDPTHGDLSCNIAMTSKEAIGMQPKLIAEIVAKELETIHSVEKVSIAPGAPFINIVCNNELWHKALADILNQQYGIIDIAHGKKINVEYVSANPTGPMHIGHMRQAVFGHALSMLLKEVGFNVTQEFYVNDAGSQIEKAALTVIERYKEALGIHFEINENMYPGEYLINVAKKLVDKFANSLIDNPNNLEIVKKFLVKMMLEQIKDDLKQLGISHDIFSSELKLHETGAIEKTIKTLEAKGLIYKGILEAPKGKVPEDYEPKEQTLFRSSNFGDDTDRPLKKSDGSYAYFAPDIAYHKDKIDRGFRDMILVLGADHGGYIKRLNAAVSALSDKTAHLDIKIIQMVSLFRNGQAVRMSKRTGSYVTLKEVVDEIGKDVVRFAMLTRKNDSSLEFDFNKVIEQSKDNPVFYVQYANARINSVFNIANEQSITLDHDKLHLLNHPKDIELLKLLCQFPKIIHAAAITHEPHRIVYYLIELASLFHNYWSCGNKDKSLRIIQESNIPLSSARLALIKAIQLVLHKGLSIIDVKPIETM